MDRYFEPGDVVELLPADELEEILGYPVEELRRFEGIQLTIAGIDPDGEVIFCHEDQERYGIDDFWIKEEYLRYSGKSADSSAAPEPDIDSFFDILSL